MLDNICFDPQSSDHHGDIGRKCAPYVLLCLRDGIGAETEEDHC